MPSKKFTEQELNSIVTKWVMRSLNATKAQAANPKTSLEYDLDATSFGVLDLLINLWEDLGLDFRSVPAVHWYTVADVIKTATQVLSAEARLLSPKVATATKEFDNLQARQNHPARGSK